MPWDVARDRGGSLKAGRESRRVTSRGSNSPCEPGIGTVSPRWGAIEDGKWGVSGEGCLSSALQGCLMAGWGGGR